MKLLRTTSVGAFTLLVAVWSSAVGQTTSARAQCIPPAASTFQGISRPEVEWLVSDVATSKPAVLKQLRDDESKRRAQLENLKQLLAFASQANQDGLAADPVNCNELEYIRLETTATGYDREINRDKGPMPPFGFIGPDRVKAFWGNGTDPAAKEDEARFQRFLDTKIAIVRASDPSMKDRSVTADEEAQAREFYAKIQIYADEYGQRAATMPKAFRDKVGLQVKLQQAQFLARVYAEKLAQKAVATDDEIAKYIQAHPEFDLSAKRKKAEAILARAKAGEDFAKLANENTDDPGNKNSSGERQGGLYSNVPKGTMVAPFEKVALALQPGQISSELVETDFGFHIVKLERKGEATDPAATYDVRHILISTGYTDPQNPSGRPVPIEQYVRGKIEEEKESRIIDELVRANNISVPVDFTVPAETGPAATAKVKPTAPKRRPVKRRH